jgi:hypothetical protein
MTFLQIFTSVVNLLTLLLILDFLRKEKLKVKYSILWFMTIVVIQCLIFFESWLNDLAKLVGVFYPPSLLFYLAFLFLFVIVLHLSLVISKLTRQNQVLAQKVALLEAIHPPGASDEFSGRISDA